MVKAGAGGCSSCREGEETLKRECEASNGTFPPKWIRAALRASGEQRSARLWWDVLKDEGGGVGGPPVHPLSREPCGAAASSSAGWTGAAAEPGGTPCLLRTVLPRLSSPESESPSQMRRGAARPFPVPPIKPVFLPAIPLCFRAHNSDLLE